MLPHFFVWHTIRGKIALGTGLFLAMLLLLGGIACYDLERIDRATRLIDMVDDLRSDVLEMRRYEKNLQLFPGRKGDLVALRGFVDLARERATSVGQDYNAAMGLSLIHILPILQWVFMRHRPSSMAWLGVGCALVGLSLIHI